MQIAHLSLTWRSLGIFFFVFWRQNETFAWMEQVKLHPRVELPFLVSTMHLKRLCAGFSGMSSCRLWPHALLIPSVTAPIRYIIVSFHDKIYDYCFHRVWLSVVDWLCQATPSFPDLEKKLSKGIEKLGGAVFPKLNWSAPRDASWISNTGYDPLRFWCFPGGNAPNSWFLRPMEVFNI